MSDLLPRPGDRIALRRLREDDFERFQAYRADPEVGSYQGWTPMTEDKALAFLAWMRTAPFGTPGKWFQLAIAEPATDLLIGDIGLCVSADSSECELGFTLAAGEHGKGLASEAVREVLPLVFEHTKVGRVFSIADVRNVAAVNLLQRVGMTLSETVDAVFRGEPCREHVFVIDRRNHEGTT